MPEIIIKYKNKRALEALHDFAKYFDFEITLSKASGKKEKEMNGISVIPGDSAVDTSDLTTIFTGKKIDPKELRKKAWQRRK
jgi:hypothetical protein